MYWQEWVLNSVTYHRTIFRLLSFTDLNLKFIFYFLILAIVVAKNGAEPSEAVDISKHVVDKCSNLELMGLMTIGRFDHDLSSGPNPDFQVHTILFLHQSICLVVKIYIVCFN